MSAPPHPSTPDHELLPAAVHAAILAVRPELAPLEVQPLGTGWDFFTYLANGRWVFRFPKRAAEQTRLRKEIALLPLIRERVPLAIPAYEGGMLRATSVPYAFGCYELLAGRQATEVDPATVDLEAAGHTLGTLFAALHAMPHATLRRAHAEIPDKERPFEGCREKARTWLRWIPASDAALCERLRQHFREDAPLPERYGGPSVFGHMDLHAEHVLFGDTVPAQMIGLLDWGDLAFGDPALELAGPYSWGGEALLRPILKAYGAGDDAMAERARWLGVYFALLDLDQARRLDRPQATQIAMHVLRSARL